MLNMKVAALASNDIVIITSKHYRHRNHKAKAVDMMTYQSAPIKAANVQWTLPIHLYFTSDWGGEYVSSSNGADSKYKYKRIGGVLLYYTVSVIWVVPTTEI